MRNTKRTAVLGAVVLWTMVLMGGACGASVSMDDAGANDNTAQDGSGTGDDAAPDATVGDLVMFNIYELEIGVNTDAQDGAGMVRWYGGLYAAVQDAVVTNVAVTWLEIDENGVLRAVVAPELRGENPIAELPGIQRSVWGEVAFTTEELSTCQASGPELHRGNWGQGDVVIRMCGTSDQGDWCAENTLDSEDLFRTCHTGISGLAEGWVYVLDNPTPPPIWFIDMDVIVYVRAPFDFDPVDVTSLVVHGEGAADTFSAPTPGGYACQGTSLSCINMSYMDEGHIGETLCPDWEAGFPPELYVTYEGTANGQPFSGTAPAYQCSTGMP